MNKLLCCLILLCVCFTSTLVLPQNDLFQQLSNLKTCDFTQHSQTLTALEEFIAARSQDPVARRQLAQQLAHYLELAGSLVCKQFICRELAQIGTENEVANLAPLLVDENLSDMARYALVNIPHPSVDQALRDALTHTKGRTRIGIINTLGNRRDLNSIGPLAQILQTDEPTVSMAAAQALGQIGGMAAAALLKDKITNYKQACPLSLLDAYLSCAERVLAGGDKKAAGKMYAFLYTKSVPYYYQGAALKGWYHASMDIGKVIAGLTSVHPELQHRTAAMVREVSDKEHVAKIAALVPNLPEETQIILLHSFAVFKDRPVVDQVERACRSEQEPIRMAGLESLGQMGNGSHAALLVERSAHGRPAEAEVARKSLSLIHDDTINEKLLSLLSTSDEKIQIKVIQALAERQVKKAIPILFKLAREGAGEVPPTSINALGKIADAAEMPDVIEIMLQAGETLQKSAQDALVLIAVRSNEQSACATMLMAKDRTLSLSTTQKTAIIRVLGQLAVEPSLPFLKEALKDSVNDIRIETIRSLSLWPNAGPANDLLTVAQKDVEPLRRILSLRGYIDLVERDKDISANDKVKRYQQAMQSAKQNAEKIKILSNLGQIPTFNSLNYAMMFVDSAAVKDEAEQAASMILQKVYTVNLGMAELIADRLISVSRNETTRKEVQQNLQHIKNDQKKENQPERFRLRVINADSRFEAATVADINRDGRPDIFCGGFWYEGPNWTRHFVRQVPEEGGYHFDFGAIPLDVNGDGWIDMVNASWHGKDVFWLKNPGKTGKPFEMKKIDEPGNLETVLSVDINGDGLIDLLPNTVASMVWYESRKNSSNEIRWTKHELPRKTAGHGLGAGDMNGDGKMDIISPKGWLENPIQENGEWKWHPEFNLGSTSIPILIHDVDRDSDADLIYGLGHDYGLYWLEQKSDNSGQQLWQKHLIDETWSQPHFPLLADLDGDGQKELIVGKRYYAHNGHDPGEEHPLCIYGYHFDLQKKEWKRQIIHEGGRVGFGIYTTASDLDGDGDIDIVAPGKSGLYVLENLLH